MQQSILVVEQDQNVLEALRDTLEQGGWHVTMAHSIQTALQAMEGNHFDVLLSWVSLGPSSGLALARLAKRRQRELSVLITVSDALLGIGKVPFVDGLVTRPVSLASLQRLLVWLLALLLPCLCNARKCAVRGHRGLSEVLPH